ncbi:hypothetical protein DXV76_19960 [Rhodobacteraceae bacterium CCMM004]|nr:hypothetical protein DXV76_19960 [Rhodobacteraceae bacterium CCMM004]
MTAVALPLALVFVPINAKAQFQDCWFDAKLNDDVGLGQQLARADRIESFADELIDFNYDSCFRLGRSCPVEFPLPSDRAVDDAHLECMSLYPSLGTVDEATWRAQRTAYNSCMAKSLRLEAEAIRASVSADGSEATPLSDVLATDRSPGTLGLGEVLAVTSDVTWCPVEASNFQTAILCRGGGMVAATFQGEERMHHRVSSGGEICLTNIFPTNETCYSIEASGGLLTLQPPHPLFKGPISVISGVQSGNWFICP